MTPKPKRMLGWFSFVIFLFHAWSQHKKAALSQCRSAPLAYCRGLQEAWVTAAFGSFSPGFH